MNGLMKHILNNKFDIFGTGFRFPDLVLHLGQPVRPKTSSVYHEPFERGPTHNYVKLWYIGSFSKLYAETLTLFNLIVVNVLLLFYKASVEMAHSVLDHLWTQDSPTFPPTSEYKMAPYIEQ